MAGIPEGRAEDVPQGRIVEPAEAQTPGTVEENAKTGGRIYTAGFNEDETRPQDLHGALAYQKETADPGRGPEFFRYTELTKNGE